MTVSVLTCFSDDDDGFIGVSGVFSSLEAAAHAEANLPSGVHGEIDHFEVKD